MKILLIGNGFDLAHELPTKYTDFLKFSKVINMISQSNALNNVCEINKLCCQEQMHSSIKLMIPQKFGDEELAKDAVELLELIKDNFWINYFLQCPILERENWIDFESEISNVIKSIDADMEKNSTSLEDCVSLISNCYVEKFFHKRLPGGVLDYGQAVDIISFKEIRDILYKDLNRLIRAFEIYLFEYVENIVVKEISEDIRNLEIDHVLSFNYSHTYQKLYGKQNVKYDYIHGETKSDSTLETNNIVLGIDEYLSKKKKNTNTDFIAFKKYYQRVYKETGCKYKNWVDEIVATRYKNEISLKSQFPKQIPYEKFNVRHKLYIFGHSLDITDKDVLRNLILNDNVYTTIFYHNKDIMGQQIENLVKVIGQDELIRRTGGNTKTIEFKQQQNMVQREN